MKIIYNLNKIKKYNKPVVALGVFDGLHYAHRRILKETVRQARAIKGTSIVVTFWPHPQKENSLYSLEHRLKLIAELSINVCIVMKFNKAFAGIPAEDFIKKVLVHKIRARYIYVGRNFRFGRNATGDFRTLGHLSSAYNFKVKVFDVMRLRQRVISSTYIRRLITKGDLRGAEMLLCRPVSVLGTVIKGSALAKRLGFPTANIDPHHEVVPPPGIYAVKAVLNNEAWPAVCYIGSKPTFEASRMRSQKLRNPGNIEVHIFDFNKNIYGKNLEIQFIRKIRNERRFACVEELAKQVKKDILHARHVFSLH